MAYTVGELLNELEKPENEGEIKHLAHFKNLSKLDEMKNIPFIGFLMKGVLSLVNKHMEAFMVLSECKTTADITAFKQSKHYKKVKNSTIGEDLDLSKLSGLKELEKLNKLESLKDI